MERKKLREIIKKKLDSQSKEACLRKSLKISEQLFALKKFKEAKVVMFYVAKDGEVETRQMILEAQGLGKRILVPYINLKTKEMQACQLKNMEVELCRGPYNILQPKEEYRRPFGLKSIDLVIVPGLAFSRDGRRLGRGGGYFDRFLKKLSAKAFKIGLAFDFQIVKNIPSLPHDVSVDLVLSA